MSLRSTVHRLGLTYASWISRREFATQRFTRLNERSVEYAFVFRQVTRAQPRAVLDVGTGATALPHLLRTCGALVTAVDNVRDYWPDGMVNRHWPVLDEDIRAPRQVRGPFDLVTCVSVLEHIPEHGRAVQGMLGLLRPGGLLVLSAPYNERKYCPNVYALQGSEVRGPLPAYVTQAFSRAEVDGWLAFGARLVEQEYWRFYAGEFWTVGERLPSPLQVSREEPHQISCLVLERS